MNGKLKTTMRYQRAGLTVVLLLLSAAPVRGQSADYLNPDVLYGTVTFAEGGVAGFAKAYGDLANTANYDWYHGCTPTSAGMLMGYYDRNGYGGQSFANLVPGGVAEANTFGVANPLANPVIASAGHIADYWGDPDPLAGGRSLPADYDSLADFIGTSQKALGNNDGWSMTWFRTSGYETTPANIEVWGRVGNDSMYGIKQYIEYAGYSTEIEEIYTQLTDNNHFGYSSFPGGGFSFDDFKHEIDLGRPVIVHIESHTMLGYGYQAPNIINVYDTWNDNDGGGPNSDGQNPGSMVWGGTYGTTGWGLWGVTALQMIPEPSTIALALIGFAFYGRRWRE